jgi:MFS family permease
MTRMFLIFGYQMLTLVIGWQMYMLTKQPWDLGLIGLLQFIPRLLLVFVAGIVIDKIDRRKLIILTLSVQALIALLLMLATLNVLVLDKSLILWACLALGICRTIDMPATQAILPDIVPEHMLAKAVSLSASSGEIATIVAPILGGALYLYGASISYIAIICAYAIAIWCMLCLTLPILKKTYKTPINISNVLMGFRYVYQNKTILACISLDLFVVLLGGSVALLPVIAHDLLKADAFTLGVLRSTPAFGALLMAFILSKYPIQKGVGKKMLIACMIFGLATIVFGLSNSLQLSLCALFILGAADMVSVVIRTSFIQMNTPSDMRGRVSSVNFLFIGASNQLGEFESGATAHYLGTKSAVVVGGFATLAIVALWLKIFPDLIKHDKLNT